MYCALSTGCNFKFSKAIRRHGLHAWKHDVIAIIEDEREAFEQEVHWIAKLQSYVNGYNMTFGGDGVVQRERSRQHRQHLSEAALNRSPKEKLRWATINVGRKHSTTTRKKLSQIRAGKKHLEETLIKLRGRTPWNKGRKLNEEIKQKMSDSRKGEKNPFYGKKHSDETKEKIRSARSKADKLASDDIF